MAISNFTKLLIRSVFPSSLISSSLLPTYKKLSYVDSEKKASEVALSAENMAALNMLTKTYRFKYRDIEYQRFSPLDICTVVSVVVKSDGDPEIGFLSGGDDLVSFCFLSDLIVQHEVIHRVG